MYRRNNFFFISHIKRINLSTITSCNAFYQAFHWNQFSKKELTIKTNFSQYDCIALRHILIKTYDSISLPSSSLSSLTFSNVLHNKLVRVIYKKKSDSHSDHRLDMDFFYWLFSFLLMGYYYCSNMAMKARMRSSWWKVERKI